MTELIPPAYDRKAEVEAILEDDDTVLGSFFRYEQQGMTAQEMSDAEGLSTLGWVSNYRTLLAVLRDGDVPTSPSLSAQSAARVRNWLKKPGLSQELRDELQTQESLLMSRAEDRRAQTEEVEEAVQATKEAEATGVPGIYVYTLPHYLRHPYDPVTGRTFLKVGHSSVDALYRANAQARFTALPEDPILLRIYPVSESASAERDFHSWLRDADHASGRTQRGGTEWYVTSTKFLDRIAKSKGLDVVVVTEFEAGEE